GTARGAGGSVHRRRDGRLAPRRRRRPRLGESLESRAFAPGPRRRRHLSGRGEGGWNRRRRDARARARDPRRARGQRCARHRRGGPPRARTGGGRVSPQPRRSEPLPLGDAELPYSKGLMARALIATGVPADQAYGLARRIEVDLAEAGKPAANIERLEVLAREGLGEARGARVVGRLAR